ncbi:hypothetical protein ACWFRF_20760 [Nocardia sp. NPDC055165]
MGWAVGYDTTWKRDIGYGVPALCDQPGCGAEIHRGLDYVCGGEPYGGETGCGLYFCYKHLHYSIPEHTEEEDDEGLRQRCERCISGERWHTPTPDVPEWITHKLTDPSWQQWRDEHPDEVRQMAAPGASDPASRAFARIQGWYDRIRGWQM